MNAHQRLEKKMKKWISLSCFVALAGPLAPSDSWALPNCECKGPLRNTDEDWRENKSFSDDLKCKGHCALSAYTQYRFTPHKGTPADFQPTNWQPLWGHLKQG